MTSSLAPQRRATAEISWQPDSLVQGSIMRLGVRPSSGETIVEVSSVAAGQPLHFEADSTGVFWALAGLPIDAPEQLSIDLVLGHPDRSDTVAVTLPVSRLNAPMERLKVAPEFARPLDSVLAARVQGERARARRVSRKSHQTPRHWYGPFVRPRDSRVTGQFGRGRLYNGQVTGRHMGVDLAGKLGDPVYAANDGVVALVADFYYAGRAVYLDHGTGLVTAYFHLSNADVLQGDLVSKGQQIGTVGASGRVTGPHLHWVARYGTISVDAESLLELGVRSEE
jgi:murein DD-endopeptidase MepM/ murein hydrolase activator NlpD